MAKKVLSIIIGSECTKVCELNYKKKYKNKGIRVYRSIAFATPEGSVEDGIIKDMNIFGDELRSRLKAAKIKSDRVIFSINSSRIANREIIIPPVKEKRIMDIIKTGASEYFPIDMNDYILSYQILEKSTAQGKRRQRKIEKAERKNAKKKAKIYKKNLKKKSKTEIIAENLELMDSNDNSAVIEDFEGGTSDDKQTREVKNQMRLAVYAAPAAMIKNYYSFAKKMHFDILAIDYYGNSSYQAIKRQSRRGTNVYVQMNEQDTIISILRDDVLILQRTVSYGLYKLINVIRDLGYGHGDGEDPLELLRNHDMLSNEEYDITLDEVAVTDSQLSKESSKELRVGITESLYTLVGNVTRMLDYYKSSYKQIDIDTIYLTGALVDIKGVDRFFSSGIGLPHKLLNKLHSVSSRKKAKDFRLNPSRFLPLIGAVISPVDFVPYEFVLKKQRRSAVIATTFLTLVCLAGSVGTIYVSYTDYLPAKKELEEIKAEYEAMPLLSGAHDLYDIAIAELEDLRKLQKLTESNNDKIKDVIEQLEKRLPSGTIIHAMSFTEEGVTMNVTANDDEAGSNALIAKTLKQLKGIEYFKDNVDISGIKVVNENGISKVNFSITCTYVN
jgi:type IV pilus assembly protein PilM